MDFKTPKRFRQAPSKLMLPYEKRSWGDVDPEIMCHARNLIWHVSEHINDTVLLDSELVTLAMYDLIKIFEYLIPFTAKAAMKNGNDDRTLQLSSEDKIKLREGLIDVFSHLQDQAKNRNA